MKLALLIAGHMRVFDEEIAQSLKNFLAGYDYDLFVVTHDTLDRSQMKDYYGHDNILTEDDIRETFKSFPLKGVKLSRDTDCSVRKCVVCREGLPEWHDPTTKIVHDQGICSTHCEKCKTEDMKKGGLESYCWRMWHNISDAYDMAMAYSKEKGIEYDYIIRARPDIMYMERIDFHKLPPLTDKLVIGFGTNLGYPNDTFAIGKGPAMAAYCDIDNVVRKSLYSHGVVADVLKRYPIYKFFDLSWKRRTFDRATGTWFEERRYHPKHQYITDPNLLHF